LVATPLKARDGARLPHARSYVEKHLLLLGAASLAVRSGAAANGTGRTWLPFWDGGAGYTSGVTIS
jgi:hypothetical protein